MSPGRAPWSGLIAWARPEVGQCPPPPPLLHLFIQEQPRAQDATRTERPLLRLGWIPASRPSPGWSCCFPACLGFAPRLTVQYLFGLFPGWRLISGLVEACRGGKRLLRFAEVVFPTLRKGAKES